MSGFVGNKPVEARWLIGVADEGDTTWWWLESSAAMTELIRYYREQEPWVTAKGNENLQHVAIHLATNPLVIRTGDKFSVD